MAIHFFLEEMLEEICSHCNKMHEADLQKEFYLNFEYLSGNCNQCNHWISFRVK